MKVSLTFKDEQIVHFSSSMLIDQYCKDKDERQ